MRTLDDGYITPKDAHALAEQVIALGVDASSAMSDPILRDGIADRAPDLYSTGCYLDEFVSFVVRLVDELMERIQELEDLVVRLQFALHRKPGSAKAA
jgi:hypothetical protein